MLSPSLQSRDSELLQELGTAPLHVLQRAEALLGHVDGGLLAVWQNGPLRHILTGSLPSFLGLLQHASLLGQQELRSESGGDDAMWSRQQSNIFSSHVIKKVFFLFAALRGLHTHEL